MAVRVQLLFGRGDSYRLRCSLLAEPSSTDPLVSFEKPGNSAHNVPDGERQAERGAGDDRPRSTLRFQEVAQERERLADRPVRRFTLDRFAASGCKFPLQILHD